MDIKITFQVMQSGVWRTLASPPHASLPTTNGANRYLTGFYAPKSYQAMRITAAVRFLGRWSRNKSTTISIRR